mmetsp:Transcript_80729/g.249019  ORF Transcript_80729/g.249019 Transcript_80729/m.249019 type:complete len:554 (+) Transcript_80729:61-1722(+)
MSASELDRALHASVLKREAAKEAEWREKRRKEEEEAQLGFGGTEMTKAELKKVIDSDRRVYYRSEDLNDKLYIHYKGWRQLRHLEGWTGLRALYAECNAFDRIQGLHCCRSLRSLFLQENCIKRIEGLENCPDLWNINLSNNFIERIEGLSHLRNLNTLTIAKNKLGLHGVEDLVELVETTVSSLDVQDNLIGDPDALPEVFMRMTELRVLYLKGNPCAKKIPNYRKSITVCCEDLRYLDDRPVFPEDRRAADAFNRGGLEEERAERRRIREENSARHERNMKAFNDMIANARAEKRERDAMRKEDKFTDDTDPVESQEKRMKRQVEKWKEENAEELKDDARERAERCLKTEREVAAADHKASDGVASGAGEAGAGGSPPAAGTDEGAAQEAGGETKRKVDARKLVYEDIWDDEPRAGTSAPSPSAVPAAAAPAATPALLTPGGRPVARATTSEVFLPWATGEGVAGMDDVAPPGAAAAQVAAGLPATASSRQPRHRSEEGGSPAPSGPAWYSRFAERSQARQEGAPAAGPAVPEARASEAEPARGSELDEMD